MGDDILIQLTNDAGSSVDHTFAYIPNQWLYVGYTWDGTTVTYYHNGISISTDALSGTLSCSAGTYIGVETGLTNPFVSIISSLCMWNYGLDSDTVKLHYRTQSPYYRQEVAPTIIL